MNTKAQTIHFWPAVPAAVAMLAGGLLTAYVVLAGGRSDVVALQAKATSATAAGKHSAAALHYQHMLALEPANPSHALALAMSLDRQQLRSEAMAVLSTVAPAAGGGYPSAHLQLAEWTIESRVMGGQLTQASMKSALHHAEAAKADPSLRDRATTLVEILNGFRLP